MTDTYDAEANAKGCYADAIAAKRAELEKSIPNSFIFSDQQTMFGERDVIGFGNKYFSVQLIDRDLANSIVVEKHYSKKFVNNTKCHFGVIRDGQITGVLQFGYAMNPASCGSVVTGTEMNEYLELNRMWLDDILPKNSASKAISCCAKSIRKIFPKVKWIQSFSDQRCGLFGTVYQAAGFSFHGEHTGVFYELDGETYHKSILDRADKMPSGARLLRNINRAKRIELRQFRYLKFMKPRFARGCNYPSLPYPKPDYAACPVDEQVPTCVSAAQPREAAPNKPTPAPVQDGLDL